jgi:hypothetical protein
LTAYRKKVKGGSFEERFGLNFSRYYLDPGAAQARRISPRTLLTALPFDARDPFDFAQGKLFPSPERRRSE